MRGIPTPQSSPVPLGTSVTSRHKLTLSIRAINDTANTVHIWKQVTWQCAEDEESPYSPSVWPAVCLETRHHSEALSVTSKQTGELTPGLPTPCLSK